MSFPDEWSGAVRIGDAVSRVAIAAIFVSSGIGLALEPGERRVVLVSSAGLPYPDLLARTAGLIMTSAAILMALDRRARVAPTLLAATLLVITPIGHPIWRTADPAEHHQHRLHIMKNLALFGALVGRATRPAMRSELSARHPRRGRAQRRT